MDHKHWHQTTIQKNLRTIKVSVAANQLSGKALLVECVSTLLQGFRCFCGLLYSANCTVCMSACSKQPCCEFHCATTWLIPLYTVMYSWKCWQKYSGIHMQNHSLISKSSTILHHSILYWTTFHHTLTYMSCRDTYIRLTDWWTAQIKTLCIAFKLN